MKAAKKFTLIFLFGIFFIPLVQSSFSFFKEKPLKGWVQPAKNAEFTLKGWVMKISK